jgi:hypothetical protein
LGRTRGQLNVAVAVWIDPVVGSVASAMMTADPFPYAVTTPPGAAGFGGVELVLTGKTLGSEESQVTELVRSLTVGAVEYVPIARKFPVSCKLPTEIVLGIMMSESRGSGAAVSETLTVAVAVSTLLSGLVHWAVIVLEPALTPEAIPLHLFVV